MFMGWLRRVIRREIEAERAERNLAADEWARRSFPDRAAKIDEIAKQRAQDVREFGAELGLAAPNLRQ